MYRLNYLIIIIFLTACGKKQTIRIIAIDPIDGSPWSGLRYTITKQKTGAFEEKYKVIEEGFLNENGKAETEVRMRNASYEINIEDPGNTCYVNNTSYTFSKNSQNYDFVFEMAPCAHLKRKIKNINCFDMNDQISITIDNQVHSTLSNPWVLDGCADYETVFSEVPYGSYYTSWTVTKNGITTTSDSTFFIQPGEYKTFEINY